jgi:hypothetical protein
MRRIDLVSVAALMLVAGEAQATETIWCRAAGDAASIAFLVGTTPGLNPLTLDMEAGEKRWSTKKEEGATPVAIAQSFSDAAGMKIDVADDNLERIIAELRGSTASEGDTYVAAGTLRIIEVGAWAVNCEGP